jgi:hypothetical protein
VPRERVGLDERDQRVFLVEVTSRANGKVTGDLRCGFCTWAREPVCWFPVSWYPDNPEQDIEAMVALRHFKDCHHRGAVTTFPLRIFEGEHDKVGTVITITIPE